MSNTYFELKKQRELKNLDGRLTGSNKYTLSLTAFVSKQDIVQLTVSCQSDNKSQSGTGFIVLNEEDIDRLIGGLLERKLKLVTAIGYEQSNFQIKEDEN